MVFASSWQELGKLTEAYPGSPAFVDPDFGGAHDPFSDRWSSSTTPLVCYAPADPTQQQADELGLSFTVRLRHGEDDNFGTIDAAILKSIDAQRAQRLMERIERSAHADTHTVFNQALKRAMNPCTVPEVAADLGLAERTLQRLCTALGIPSPKRLVSLGRIFTVERLAEWSRQPSGAVALALGFSDRSNYRRLVRRNLGDPPSVIHRQGGVEYVEEVIVRALAGSTRHTTGAGIAGPY